MSSRKEEKARLREERLKREQEAAATQGRKRLVGYVVAGVLVAAAIGAIVVVVLSGGDGASEKSSQNLKQAAAAAGCTVQDYPDFGNSHTTDPVEYKTNPPTSGDHNPVPTEDNVYIESPKETAHVHALEHGRIVIQYAPNAPPAAKDDLKEYYDGLAEESDDTSQVKGDQSGGIILTPNTTKMPFAVAATAWRHSLTCKRYGDKDAVFAALDKFREQYRGQGPEAVPY